MEKSLNLDFRFCACEPMSLEEWKHQSDEILSRSFESFEDYLNTCFPIIEDSTTTNICRKCGKEFDGSKPTPNDYNLRARQRIIQAAETMSKFEN